MSQDYNRRRRIAEAKIAEQGLMPTEDFIVGALRVAAYEDLILEHLPPPSHVDATLEREPEPTQTQIAAAMKAPPAPSDPVTRTQAMADQIGADMAIAAGEGGGRVSTGPTVADALSQMNRPGVETPGPDPVVVAAEAQFEAVQNEARAMRAENAARVEAADAEAATARAAATVMQEAARIDGAR